MYVDCSYENIHKHRDTKGENHASSSSHQVTTKSGHSSPHVVGKKEQGGALAVLHGNTETKLNGVLNRIDTLIGGYTKGASVHSSFLRHFDQDSVVRGGATLKSVSSSVDTRDGDVLFLPSHKPPSSKLRTPNMLQGSKSLAAKRIAAKKLLHPA
jgi:hypothetical protein